MFAKGNKFFSDYTDSEGKRHRKAHSTALAATRFEEKNKRAKASRPVVGRMSRTTSPSPSIGGTQTTRVVSKVAATTADSTVKRSRAKR